MVKGMRSKGEGFRFPSPFFLQTIYLPSPLGEGLGVRLFSLGLGVRLFSFIFCVLNPSPLTVRVMLEGFVPALRMTSAEPL